jgi:hypothetical protein
MLLGFPVHNLIARTAVASTTIARRANEIHTHVCPCPAWDNVAVMLRVFSSLIVACMPDPC